MGSTVLTVTNEAAASFDLSFVLNDLITRSSITLSSPVLLAVQRNSRKLYLNPLKL